MKSQITILVSLLCISLSSYGGNWLNIATPEQINEIKIFHNKYYVASNGGLVVYDPASGITEHKFVTDGLPSIKIEEITRDENGTLWIGTYDNGIAFQQGDDWIPINKPIESQPNTLLIYCMEFDEDGILWTGTSNGIQKYENGSWSVESSSPVWDMVKLPDGRILSASTKPILIENGTIQTDTSCPIFAYSGSCVATDTVGNLLFSAPGFGVAHKTNQGWQIFNSSNSPITTSSMSDMEIGHDGKVWGMIAGSAVLSFDGNSWKEEFTSSNLANFDFNTSQLLPVSNGVVIGTSNSLTLFDGSSFSEAKLNYNDLSVNSMDTKVLPNGKVIVKSGNSLFEYDPSNYNYLKLPLPDNVTDISNLWLVDLPSGSYGLFDKSSAMLYQGNSAINIFGTANSPLHSGNSANCFLADDNGNYWVGTFNGLYYTDGSTIDYYTDTNSVFYDPSFWTLGEDNAGNIWASTPDGIGVFDGVQWTYYDATDYNHMFGGAGYDFYFDNNNEMWFCGWGTGLVHFDGVNWEAFTTGNSNIADHLVFDIEEYNGDLYLATREGLSIFDGSDFTNITEDNSDMINSHISEISIDMNGSIWLSHPNTGMSVYNKNGISVGMENPVEDVIMVDIYPNPATEIVNIILNEISMDVPVRIFNTEGKVLYETKDNHIRLSTSSFKPGVYFVTAGTHVKKLVIK